MTSQLHTTPAATPTTESGATAGLSSAAILPHVATDLSMTVLPGVRHDDVIADSRVYRRLTTDYYVWLRSRMEIAQKKHAQGLLPDVHYQAMRMRFNAMHDSAVAWFGEEKLLAALATVNPNRYLPPTTEQAIDVAVARQEVEDAVAAGAHPVYWRGRQVWGSHWQGVITSFHAPDEYFPNGWVDAIADDGTPVQADARGLLDEAGRRLEHQPRYTAYELRAIALARDETPEDFADLEASLPILSFSAPGTWRFEAHPSFDDFLKVNEIRERAQALGWTDADLFQTSGQLQYPYGQDYGLVCFLRGRTPGDITADAITLLPDTPGGALLSFQRPHRTAPKEASYEPISETLPQRRPTPAETVAGGTPTVRRRKDAVRAASGHATRLQPAARVGPAHAGLFGDADCLSDRPEPTGGEQNPPTGS